jgi:hypothetical protein
VLIGGLVGAAGHPEWIVVIEHAEVRSGLCPDVVWFRWMDVRRVGRAGQHVVIGVGVCRLVADTGNVALDQVVEEGRSGIVLDLLLASRELAGGLCPVLVFHRDDEHVADRGGTRLTGGEHDERRGAQQHFGVHCSWSPYHSLRNTGKPA